MGKTNMVEIDTSATREAVYDSGKTLAVLSEEIGRCPSYLSYAVNNGRIPEYAFRRLCVLLGVSEGDLLKKQAVIPPQKAEAEAVSGCETIGYSVKLDVYPKRYGSRSFSTGKKSFTHGAASAGRGSLTSCSPSATRRICATSRKK